MTNHLQTMRRTILPMCSNPSRRHAIESSPRKNATSYGATQRNDRHITVVDQDVVTLT